MRRTLVAIACLVFAACETDTSQQQQGGHRGIFTHCATCATSSGEDAGSNNGSNNGSDGGSGRGVDGGPTGDASMTPMCTPSCTGKSCGPDGCGGTCGAPCAMGQVCTRGQCAMGTCPAGTIDCHSSCTDYLVDANNCGACDDRCPTRATATTQCIVGMCYLHCPGQENQRVSVDLDNDPENCGACGHVCPQPIQGPRTCTNGVCAGACPSGKTPCGGQCVDLSRDANNCGACSHACPAPQGGSPYCSNRQCVGTCPSGQGVCNNTCIDISNDMNNCGGCGLTCSAFASQHALANTTSDTVLACMAGKCTGKFSPTQSETCTQLCSGLGLSCVAPPSNLVSTWWNRCPSPQHNLGGAYWITQATGGGCTNYSDQAHIASIAFDQECTDFAPSPDYQWTFNNQPQPMYFDTMWCTCQ